MPSPPLDNTHGRMTLSVACHHRPWTAHTIGLRRAWHDITTFGQHTQSNDVSHGMPPSPLAAHTVERCRAWHAIIAYGRQTPSNDVRRDMPSPPLDNTLDRATFGVACHHRGWAAHTIERRRALHDITSLGMHAWLDDVGSGITSPPLVSILGRQHRAWHEITSFGQHTRSKDIGHGIPSSPLGSTHGQTTLGVT